MENKEEKKTKVVDFSQLEEGMIVAKEVQQNGKVLLRKDIPITGQMIKKIRNILFIGTVEVYDKKVSVKKKVANYEKEKQYIRVQEEFKEIAFKLQKTFRQLINDDEIAMHEVREFAKKIQSELTPSSIVIKNIVLYGSGDDSIYRHSVNVAALSAIIGKWIGYDHAKLNSLVYSAILHDYGKTKIDRELLKKEATLTTNEFNVIKTHAQLGYKFVKEIKQLDTSVSYGVLMHHERLDGSGYPLGLKDEAIHAFARIIAIADVFDAMNSDRGYKKKRLPFEALQIVKNESLGKLDYEYTKVFLEHIVDYYTGEEVLLNTNETCKIIKMNPNDLEKPLILKDNDFIDLTKEKEFYIKEVLI
ncbi:HD-GYP domain-containing protein (c-di-GMP phosphodiesterase class II) [Clostridium saccharoperbutylacetonicum]|uniref:HD-GYP domain-containing protein n=1 Tax=Clostridium saccharoperbutylacetonicum N1-4(HMT) TaxID=931276 RepID=M1MKT7_9CLOT|nr:HD-GYP domain-containing protein [Clostridium saccharoperbutylacetonicum]AGF55426.1 HD-GYP domain-containing protein [Clostridium saccharoperbutylacetonicum N1-4(HMT)]NRT63860.1 HD-GYP domain-containing protein (c-di-GMP phosphodiesterase class II) [Clostridium saccharoperbutylacetonicum]NSB27224.1 HD-GYP domain-containing protein (c-di-GMP phosphodiesterase class II) [Clostridium saccharoperbutylacetonicum]NSB40711.1 HD-GYP domain-containing protein (c-di-GMP phosphodiesterase class II) [Cl